MDANTKPEAAQLSPESKPEKPGKVSSQQKCVLLFEWWLMKTNKEYDGRRLAVGGFTRRRDTVRIFNSVPVVKRHDPFTLETANGIVLKIEGSLNKTRTIGNEFPFEACSTFLFGFPDAWEFFACKYGVNQDSHQLIQEPKLEDTFESHLQPPTVMLRDWWLCKICKGDGHQLSVSGLTKRGKATRLFNSAPIIKRHNAYMLETVDGMNLRLEGLIDKTRTINNGFTDEVCRNFLVGFPVTWANFVNESTMDKPCHGDPTSASTGTEWSKGSTESMAFQFPSCLENRVLEDVPSSPSAVATDSFARPRKGLHKFMPHFSMPKMMQSPLCDGAKTVCSNVPQDDEVRETKISTSPVARLHKPIQKLMAYFSLLEKIHMPLFDGDHHHMPEKIICSNAPPQDDETSGAKICSGSADIDSAYIEKEKVMQNIHHKFDESSNKRGQKLRFALSKSENLLGDYHEFSKSSNEPIRGSKRLKLSSVLDEDCQCYSQLDCMPNNLNYFNLSADGSKTTDMMKLDHNSAKGSPLSPTKVSFASSGHLSVEIRDCHQQSRNIHGEGFVEDNSISAEAIGSQTSERRMTRLEEKKKDIQIGRRGMKEREVEVPGDIQQYKDKGSCRVGRKTVWVSSYKDVSCTPSTRIKEKKLSILTPDSLNLKRSRSGRVLVPRLDSSMRIIYDADGSIAGTAPIQTLTTMCKGSRTNPVGMKEKKRRRISSSR